MVVQVRNVGYTDFFVEYPERDDRREVVRMTVRSDHAPVFVRAMLCEAIAFGDRHAAWWEWFDTAEIERYPWTGQKTTRWTELDAKGRARWFTSQLWNCGDIVPAEYLAVLDLAPGMTYARVVSLLRRDLEPDAATQSDRRAVLRSRAIINPSGGPHQ
jgi:hypothetical protein